MASLLVSILVIFYASLSTSVEVNDSEFQYLQSFGHFTDVHWWWVSNRIDYDLIVNYNASAAIGYVRFTQTPSDTTHQYKILKSIYFTSHSENYKTLELDLVHISFEWNQALSSNFVALRNNAMNESYPNLILLTSTDKNNEYISIPDWIDFPILYYNANLLELLGGQLPTNLTELFEMAYLVQTDERNTGRADFWGYLFSLYQEDITCVTLEFVSSMNGGNIIESNGEISIDNEYASSAIQLMKQYFGNITDPNVLTYNQQQILDQFLSGNALFVRGWYSTSLSYMQYYHGSIYSWNITRLPSYATLGGKSLAINKNTKMLNASTDFAQYLTSFESSEYKWNETEMLPPYKSFLDNIDGTYCNYLNRTYFGSNVNLCSMNLTDLTGTYLRLRPSYIKQVGDKYYNVSLIIQNVITTYLLSDTMTSDEAVKEIKYELQYLLYNNQSTLSHINQLQTFSKESLF